MPTALRAEAKSKAVPMQLLYDPDVARAQRAPLPSSVWRPTLLRSMKKSETGQGPRYYCGLQ